MSRLANDCFALPPGVAWTPVDEALRHLQDRLEPVTGVECVPLANADGRVLAHDAWARRAHPPLANAAVDGYGFATATATVSAGAVLPLVPGRAAAGSPFAGAVPQGAALRVLTGAPLPEGVDTVVLEEDVTVTEGGGSVRLPATLKAGANTRPAGEDVAAGALALPGGHRLRPQDVALLAAVGLSEVTVRRRLTVGVVSTGDELRPAGAALEAHQIPDSNRPMLLALVRRWGHEAVDLGSLADRRDAVRAAFDAGAAEADVILSTGGASAGDEDHVAALLNEAGTMGVWRIAMKPGRPLALGMWRGVPVFGLPGNPVAAFVTALIFAAPSLSRLAGGAFAVPTAISVPSAFEKAKKAGRREYLRARLTPNGTAEVFASEGSGRISGLSWSTGLVELPDEAHEVRVGDPVRYLAYEAFG